MMIINPYVFAAPAPAGLWTPADLPAAPAMWQKETGFNFGTGTDIQQWSDESGNARHLIQTTSESRPTIVTGGLDGKPVAIFDGLDDVLLGNAASLNIIQNKTYGWSLQLYKKTVAGSAADKANFSVRFSSVGWIANYIGSTRGATQPTLLARRLEGDSAAFFDGTSLTADWHILLATVDWANGIGSMYIDGALATTQSPFTSSGSSDNIAASEVVLGSGSSTSLFADVSIAEHLAGNSTLSADDADRLAGYIAWKWGLESILPIGFIYKLAAPMKPSRAWTPADLPNLYAWFKADDPSSVVSGSNYTKWIDLSGNGHDATVTAGAVAKVTAGIGSLDAGRFTTNSSNIMTIANSSGFLNNKAGACFAALTVPEYTGSTNLGHMFGIDTNDLGFARFYVRYPDTTAMRPSLLGRRLDADTLQRVPTPANVTGVQALVVNVNYSAAKAEIHVSGTMVVNTTFQTAGNTSPTNSNGPALIGNLVSSSNSYAGLFAEILLLDTALSANNVARLEGYMYWRCGQQALLPSNHPYKNAAPTV
jgi:hypothetical protein